MDFQLCPKSPMIEKYIVEKGFSEGWIKPVKPLQNTGKRVAVIGSGPAGLAAAQQLNRAGHRVTVYEKDNKIGGLLRYGIPDFKMEKTIIDRRLEILIAEGIEFITSIEIGKDISAEELEKEFDVEFNSCLIGKFISYLAVRKLLIF